MRTLGVLEARTDFSAIVSEVERTGEEIVVTRHGRPAVKISRIDPPEAYDESARRALIANVLAMRDSQPDTEPFDIREALGRDRGEEWS